MAGFRINLNSGVDRWLGRASDAIVGITWSTSASLFSVIRRFYEWLEMLYDNNESYRTKVEFGDESTVNGASSAETILVDIDEDYVAEIYYDTSGKIRIGKRVGDTIVLWGVEKEWESHAASLINARLLDGDATAPTIAIAYVDGDDSKGKMVVVSFVKSTLVVTAGTPSIFAATNTTGNVRRLGLCIPLAGVCVVAYRNEDHATDAIESVAVVVTGVVVGTWGTMVVTNVSASTNASCETYGDGNVIYTYTDSGGLNVKTNTVTAAAVLGTPAAEKVITTDTTIVAPSLASHQDDKFILAFQDGDVTNDPLQVVAGVISSAGVITNGKIRTLTSEATTEIQIRTSDFHEIGIVYVHGARAYFRMMTIEDEILYWADEYMFNDAVSLTCTLAFMTHSVLITGCEDDGGSDYAVAKVGLLIDAKRKLQTRAKIIQGNTASGTAVTILEIWGSGVIQAASFAGSGANNYTVVATVDELEQSIVVSATQATPAHLAYDNDNPDTADAFILSKETNFTSAEQLRLSFRDHFKITLLTAAGTCNYKIYYNEDGD